MAQEHHPIRRTLLKNHRRLGGRPRGRLNFLNALIEFQGLPGHVLYDICKINPPERMPTWCMMPDGTELPPDPAQLLVDPKAKPRPPPAMQDPGRPGRPGA